MLKALLSSDDEERHDFKVFGKWLLGGKISESDTMDDRIVQVLWSFGYLIGAQAA